jgi:NADH dehydrogenase FAD-containing subunit
MVAAIFKKNNIKGKVVLLDANPDITIKKDGFHAAFDQLYKGVLEYYKDAEIEKVDVAKREVTTKFDTFKFDDAAIYPRIRASKLLERIGVANPKNPQMEANVDLLKYNVIGDKRVYVTGDSRPMPFSKSGNTANSEARYVAKVIAARAQGKEIEWESPHTICYSAVSADPLQSISVDAYYKFNPKDQTFGFDRAQLFEKWDTARGQANLEWARGLYRDMFS